MSALELTLKTALRIIRHSLPEVIYLHASYIQRKARGFRAISEAPTLFHRVAISAALALVCVIASYLSLLLDPAKDFPGLMSAEKRAVWAALVPVIAALPMHQLMRHLSVEPNFFTFLNLGFVTSTALMVIPGIIALTGFHASSLDTDYARLRAGRAEGSAVHQFICGGLESQAIELALLRHEERIQPALQAALSGMPSGRQEMNDSQRETEALLQQLQSTEDPRDAEVVGGRYLDALRRRLVVTQREVARTNEVNRLMQANNDVLRRSIQVIEHQTSAPWRFAKAYPVASLFLGIASLVGMLLWVFAGVICWALVGRPQPTKWRRRLTGVMIVALFFIFMAGFGLLRSGLLEVLIQEAPASAVVETQLRARYELMSVMCPDLETHGLW
ncbi:MAG TPA: hypothetical protein VF702_01295 [Allosphingosinicella sp.]|jgi:hypothetical protein